MRSPGATSTGARPKPSICPWTKGLRPRASSPGAPGPGCPNRRRAPPATYSPPTSPPGTRSTRAATGAARSSCATVNPCSKRTTSPRRTRTRMSSYDLRREAAAGSVMGGSADRWAEGQSGRLGVVKGLRFEVNVCDVWGAVCAVSNQGYQSKIRSPGNELSSKENVTKPQNLAGRYVWQKRFDTVMMKRKMLRHSWMALNPESGKHCESDDYLTIFASRILFYFIVKQTPLA